MFDFPPTDLNVLGRILPQDSQNIIMVGSRKMSDYGYRVIKRFIPILIKKNYTIINGFSLGCESEILKTTLLCGGRAVGILPFGLDFIKGDFNKNNIENFIKQKNSVLISPFAKEQKPSKETFSYRNYLMLSLSQIVIVVEAGSDSKISYLINSAVDMGKDVYCVPGSIFDFQSRGANKMIKEGACLLDNLSDIFLSKF